jgi:hypothetical protein
MIAACTSWLLGRNTLEQKSKPTYALTQMVSVRNGSEPWVRGFNRIGSLTQMVSARNGSEPWDRGFSGMASLYFLVRDSTQLVELVSMLPNGSTVLVTGEAVVADGVR